MTRRNNNAGFGIIEVVLVLVVLAAIGLGGWVVAHHSKKTSLTNNSAQTVTSKSTSTTTLPKTAPTTDELSAVAKQVYFQVAADGSNPPTVGTCGVKDLLDCPFTTALNTKMSSAQAPSYNPHPAGILVAGSQNGPFGTVTYDAVPAAQGGLVTVTATPDASLGDPTLTWKLTMTQVGSKLLVNDITYTEGAFANTKACGPVLIYNYLSCRR